MGHQGRIARVGDQSDDAIDNADPAISQRQKRNAAIGGDAPAIEGGADFLAPHAWQIEQKTGIVIHGGRGASCVPDRVGFDNRILFQNNQLRYARQPVFSTGVNKTG